MRFCRHWKAASVGQNSLSGDKEKVFALIVWKMQQAVQPPYIYEDVLVTVCCQDRKFTAKIQKCLAGGTYRNACSVCRTGKSKDMDNSPRNWNRAR